MNFKEDVTISIDDARNEAVIQHGSQFPKMIAILNKWSPVSASEVRLSNIKRIAGNRSYQIIYRSKDTICNYTDDDYAKISDKLSGKLLKSYVR